MSLRGTKSSRPSPPQGSRTCDHAASAPGHPSRQRGLPVEEDRQWGAPRQPQDVGAGPPHLLAGCGHLCRHSAPTLGRETPTGLPGEAASRHSSPLARDWAEFHGARGHPPRPQEQQDEGEPGRRGGRLWAGRRPAGSWGHPAWMGQGCTVETEGGLSGCWLPAPAATASDSPKSTSPACPRHVHQLLLHGTGWEPVSEPRGPPGSEFLRSLESEHDLVRTGKSGNQGSLTTTDSKVRAAGHEPRSVCHAGPHARV